VEWSKESVRALYRLIGRRVQQVRQQQQVTQAELGDAVGLTRSSIANIEAGRQHAATHVMLLIAHSLRVPVTELLPGGSALDDLATVAAPSPNLEGQSLTTHDFVMTAVRRAQEGRP